MSNGNNWTRNLRLRCKGNKSNKSKILSTEWRLRNRLKSKLLRRTAKLRAPETKILLSHNFWKNVKLKKQILNKLIPGSATMKRTRFKSKRTNHASPLQLNSLHNLQINVKMKRNNKKENLGLSARPLLPSSLNRPNFSAKNKRISFKAKSKLNAYRTLKTWNRS